MTSTGTAIVDPLAPDQPSWRTGINTFPDFSFSVEIGEGDVESVEMRWYDRQEKEDTVEDDIFVQASEHPDREGWEDDIEDADD